MVGESYELLFQIRSAGESALAKIRTEVQAIGNESKSAMASVDKLAGGGSELGGVFERAKGALAGIDSQLGLANVSMLQVVGSAVGIGAAIVGAVNAAGNLYNALGPVVQTSKENLSLIKQANEEADRLRGVIRGYQLNTLERQIGHISFLFHESTLAIKDARTYDAANIAALEKERRLTQEIAASRGFILDAIRNGLDFTGVTSSPKKAREKIDILNAQIDAAQVKQLSDVARSKDLADDARERQREAAAARAKKAREELAAAEKAAHAQLEGAQLAELTGIDKILAKREQLLATYGKTAKAIADINEAARLEIQTAAAASAGKASKSLDDSLADSDKAAGTEGKRRNKAFAKELEAQIKADEAAVSSLESVLDRYDRATVSGIRRQADKALKLAGFANPGDEVRAANSAYVTQLAAARQILDIETERSNRIIEHGDREKALADARLHYEDEIDKARTDHEIALLELRKKSLDDYRAVAGKVFDSLKSGGGIGGFLSGQANNLERQLFTNASGVFFQKAGQALGGLIPGQTGADGKPSIVGTLLAGTVFDQKNRTLETVTDRNTKATEQNTAALKVITAGGAAIPGASGDLASFASDLGGFTGSGSSGLSVVPGLNKLLGSRAGTLAQFFGGFGALSGNPLGAIFTPSGQSVQTGAGTADTFSTAERVGAAAGTAAVIATGAFAAKNGIQQGGARGFTSAAAAGLGVAAALDPEPISKAVLAIAATTAGLIGGFLGDPKVNRDKEIANMLRNQGFIAPPTINQTTDAAGFQISYDEKGNARSLPVQGFSLLNGYNRRTQNGGYRTVAGEILDPLDSGAGLDFDMSRRAVSAPTPIQVVQNIVIHAIDSQDVARFFDRNSGTAATALIKEIKMGHPAAQAIQQVVFAG